METDKNDSRLPCVGVYSCVSSLLTISFLRKSYHCDLHVKDIDRLRGKACCTARFYILAELMFEP